MASAAFTIEGSSSPVTVTAGATVDLALVSVTGVRTVTWSIIGGSDSTKTAPTITSAGSPLGATATFTMNTPVGAVGLSWIVKCVVNGGVDDEGTVDAALTSTGIVGVVNGNGYLPFALGENLERQVTNGIVDDFNAQMVISASGGEPMPSGTEDGQIAVWQHSSTEWLPGRTIRRANIDGSALPGLIVHNPTAATSAAAEWSPAIIVQGEAWSTSAGGSRREIMGGFSVIGSIDLATVYPEIVFWLDEAVEGTTPGGVATAVARFHPDGLHIESTSGHVHIGDLAALERSGTDLLVGTGDYNNVTHSVATGGAHSFLDAAALVLSIEKTKVFIADSSSAPAGNPSGGFYAYGSSGTFIQRSSAGPARFGSASSQDFELYRAGTQFLSLVSPSAVNAVRLDVDFLTFAGNRNLKSISALEATTTGDAGDIEIQGQDAMTAGTGKGGSIIITGGAAVGTDQQGGDVLLKCGNRTGSGTLGAAGLVKTTGAYVVQVNDTGLGLHGATPVAQHSSTGETVGFTAGAGTTVTDQSTFTGNVGATAYRISDIVKALKNVGIMAA